MAKTIEMDEAEVAELQRLANFTRAGLSNPKTRETILRVQKTLDPNAAIPELDARDGVMDAVKEVSSELAKMRKEMADIAAADAEKNRTAELQGRVARGHDYLRGQGYNPDGITKIEEVMLAENISSYPAGLAYFEKLNPPAKPADASTQRWIPPHPALQTADNKELWESQGDSETWLRDSIASARNDFRQ